jgi:hypothetical protein
MLEWLGRIGTGIGTAGTMLTTNWALAMSTLIGILVGAWSQATQWGYTAIQMTTLFALLEKDWTLPFV